MTKKEALEQSIRKWEKNVRAVKKNLGGLVRDPHGCGDYGIGKDDVFIFSNSCALCTVCSSGAKKCYKCPVNVISGYGCEATPWNDVCYLLEDYACRDKQADEKLLEVFESELTFLRSLRGLAERAPKKHNGTVLRLNQDGEDRLRRIRQEILDGNCGDCPEWVDFMSAALIRKIVPRLSQYKRLGDDDYCMVCRWLFPRVRGRYKCPCYRVGKKTIIKTIDSVLTKEIVIPDK